MDPLSPLLTQSQGFVPMERGKAAPGRAPALSTPIIPYAALGLALPSWFLWHPCPSLPFPRPHPNPPARRGSDPPMAMSRLLGGFHVSVIILPVTATTCGAPSGGPGTTSESHRSSFCWSFRAQWLCRIPKPWGCGPGTGWHSHRGRGKARWLPGD